MADQHSIQGSGTSDVGNESSETTVELNIKTLDSQIYSLKVDKNMPVSLFKEKIASEVGLPVGQQRLIFRGKVLKDNHLLSEYHVENGHTLHLVARQPSESQPPSGTSSGETSTNNGNRGNDANTAGPRNRIGQISHSVVLGTLNVGDQGEGIMPDLTRVIGAVLNSIGIGGQAATNVIGGVQPTVQFGGAQVPQGNETVGTGNNAGAQSQAGSQVQPGQSLPSQSLPQVLQIPLGAAISVPSHNAPIPDSLHSLSEFMTRMELALSHTGFQPNLSPISSGNPPTVELPPSARGLSTREALAVVLRHAQRLLSGHAVATLSHIAGRLEQEGGSTDPAVRDQIQTESRLVGLAMHDLGALLLELGRTILTLHMGQSPAESFVNAGPAVYITPSRPNPLMVQPFPLQTNSLIGGFSAGPSNTGNFGPVGVATIPRHVNIHIHTAVGQRAPNAEGVQGETVNRSGSGDSGQTGSPPDSVLLSRVIADVNSRIRNLVQPSSGQSEGSTVQNPSVGSGVGNAEGNNQLRNLAVNDAGVASLSASGSLLERDGQKAEAHLECQQTSNDKIAESCVNSKDLPSSSSVGSSNNLSSRETSLKSVDNSECTPRSGQGNDNPEVATVVPLGLGLGGLQPKRRSGTPRSQSKGSDSAASSSPSQNQQARANGQQVLQSLASLANRRNTNSPTSGQLPTAIGRNIDSFQIEGQGVDDQFDAANAMSQVLHSPALNGLLSGVSQQTGIGSPDVLRSMLEQFTQNPAMRNTVNQIAQQFDGQDVGNMFSGLGRGQGGGIDLTSMVQQMMPLVSQALGSGSAFPRSIPAARPDPQPHYNQRSVRVDEGANDQDSQIDLQQVVQRIEHQNPPGEIFRSMVESAARLSDSGSGGEQLVNQLCREEGLANEFVEVLCHDLHQRLHGEKGSVEKS